jgi:hypothetical protein
LNVPVGRQQRDRQTVARGIARYPYRAGGKAPVAGGRCDSYLDVTAGDRGNASREVSVGGVVERHLLESVLGDVVVLFGYHRHPVFGGGTGGGGVGVCRAAIGFERERREGADGAENHQQG